MCQHLHMAFAFQKKMRPPRTIIGKAEKTIQSFVNNTIFPPNLTYSNLDWHRLLLFSVLVAITGMNTAHLTPPGRSPWPPGRSFWSLVRSPCWRPTERDNTVQKSSRDKISAARETGPNPQFICLFWAAARWHLLLMTLPTVLRNMPDMYIPSALSLGHLMTENIQTPAVGTTRPTNAQPCYCCKMLKASALLREFWAGCWVMIRLPQVLTTWSRDSRRESWTPELVEGHRPWRYLKGGYR